MSLSVQRADLTQIPAIQSLERDAFGLTWDQATFCKELSRPNGTTVVALSEGEVVGSALLVWAADEVQLNSIVLDPKVRGRGWSAAFLGTLLAWCQEEDFSWVTLEVKWNNPPALALYRKFGFATSACRKAYYADGQDARLMWAGHLQSPGHLERLRPYRDPSLKLRCPA